METAKFSELAKRVSDAKERCARAADGIRVAEAESHAAEEAEREAYREFMTFVRRSAGFT